MTLPPNSRCPHCGNADTSLIESNGEKASSPHLTLLCLKRLPDAELSYAPADEDRDARGLAVCGMQWDPNTDPP